MLIHKESLKNKKNLLFIGIIVLILMLAGALVLIIANRNKKVSPPLVTSQASANVQITEDGFVPSTLKVKSGTVVIWTNVDTENHRVAANPFPTHSDLPGLDSQSNMDSNGTYRYTFDKPGTYAYHDELNPKTNGTIVVE